jgi:hypothetical protein
MPSLAKTLIPTAIIRNSMEYEMFLSIQFFLMDTNIPTANTGNLSMVCESTPCGEVQSKPIIGLSVRPLMSMKMEMIVRVTIGHLQSKRYSKGERVYKIMMVGMNHRSKLNKDHHPNLRPSFNIATDEPNKKKKKYLVVPHKKQLGMILLNLRL